MPAFSKEFPLDPDILGQGSAAGLTVDAPDSAEAAAAIAANHPFPSGTIALGRIAVSASTGSGLAFMAGATTVSFSSSAEIHAGIGIFDSAADAVASLGLPSSKGIVLNGPPGPGVQSGRWAAMRWAYSVTGAVSGSRPIGVVGALSVDVIAKRGGVYGVMHRFDAGLGARDVLTATSKSWRLPRQVGLSGADVNLAPNTWLVAEVDGSLSLTVGASLGYDVSFMRESPLGLTRDLGATIDAKLKATFGVTASGSYLVMVGREDADPASKTVRLRLHKQSKKGLDFALNLNVGVSGTVPLPDSFDDFVEVVFGVHGQQVFKDLQVLEKWTDPKSDLGDNVARLTTKTGLDLLRHATGLDPAARFDEAKGVVLDTLGKWDALPPGLAATTWQFLSKTTPADDISKFKTFLGALAGFDATAKSQALTDALGDVLAGKPQFKWIQAVADRGVLAAVQDLDRLSALAQTTLAALDGDVAQRLHDFIGSSLDLTPIRQAAQDTDFDALNEWLVGRLGDAINKTIAGKPGIDDLKQIQQAVFAADRKVKDVYASGIEALTRRYAAEFAATYQRTAADTALLDASFDLSRPASLAMFRRVVDEGVIDQLLVADTDGVTLHEAALSHELNRTTNVELRLPFLTADVTHLTQSLASLSVEEHAGRVLLYEFSASDKVTTANRAQSELSILGTLRVAPGGSALAATGTVAYEARQVAKGMPATELDRRTRPFVETYLSALFPGGAASIQVFYDAVNGSGSRVLGDVAVSMQVTYPAGVLASWLMPRDEAAVRADGMRLSRSVQFSLRRLLPRTYLENIDNLVFTESVAALLVWASMPVSTAVGRDLAPVRFNTDRDFFWDYATRDTRAAVAQDPHTAASLAAILGDAEARLRGAGKSNADLFKAARVGQFVQKALSQMGDDYLFSLLNAEALIVSGATEALRKIAATMAASSTAPATAVRTLSEFAGTLVDTFNGRLQFLYTPEAVRTLGPTMLAEASAAIYPGADAVRPGAMLTLYVLGQGHTFALNDFLTGALPPRADVAAAQTLVSL